MLQRIVPAGFIAPCLPTRTDKLPSGSEWLHEIKHDGFRVTARKNGAQVKLYSRPGNDLTYRSPLLCATSPAPPIGSSIGCVGISFPVTLQAKRIPLSSDPLRLMQLRDQKPTLNYKPTLFFLAKHRPR
jgi:ATP dependent DNA ligase domain